MNAAVKPPRRNLKENTLKRILCLSDLHPGSIYGLLPPDFQSIAGHIVRQNKGQKYLWDCWNHMISAVTVSPVDAVVIVGDVVEGKQPRSHCAELSLPLVKDQENAAKTILHPLVEATKCPLYFVKGTFYHDDEVGRSVDNIAELIGAKEYEGLGIGIHAKEVLDLDVDGVVIDFSHGISVSGGLYRAVAIDREALWSALSGKEGKAPKADVIVRAHAHYFVHVEHPSKHAVILPAWQLQTSYQRKHSRYRMIPDIGSVILHVDGEKKKQRQDPCRVEKFLYDLPDLKPTKL